MNRFVEVVVSCKQIKFSVNFCCQLKLITSHLKISLTKTVFVNTAGRVLKFSLSWSAQLRHRLLKFLLLLLKTKQGVQTILSWSKQDLLNLLLTFLCGDLHIVITKYGDFLVLLVQFIRFGEMLLWILRLIWLKTGKATANKTAKLN